MILLAVSNSYPQQNDQDSPVTVIVEKARIDNFYDRIEALGTLRANETVEITANVTETVEKINFDDSQRVKKGYVLLEMDSSEEKALMKETMAEVREAEKQLKRIRDLRKRGAASESLLDEWQRNRDSAVARLAVMESRISDRTIRAPFDGVVGIRHISPGALVEPGTVITTLNDDSIMKLDFTVPSLYLQALNRGLPVNARSKALGNMEFSGEIYSIDNKIDPVSRSITVRAYIPNDEGLLKQGMLMNVELHKNSREAVVISEEALIPEGEDNYVLVVKENGNHHIVEKRKVETGSRRVGEIEVVSGLEAGEWIVTHGTTKARNGQRVSISAVSDGSGTLRQLLSNDHTENKKVN